LILKGTLHSLIKSSTIRNFFIDFIRTDNFNFKELPELDKFNISKANDFNNNPFTGNPATILINIQGDGEAPK
jgi:hypothetical protein